MSYILVFQSYYIKEWDRNKWVYKSMGLLQIIIIIIDLFLVDNKNTIAIITNKLIKVNFNEKV